MGFRFEAKDVTSAEEKKSAQRTDTEIVNQIVTWAKANNRDAILNLRKPGVDIVNLRDQNNRDAAQHLAAEENVNRDALNLLFSLGAEESRAAGTAAEVGNFVLVKDLIRQCHRPNTVVLFAAKGNQLEIVEFLLKDWKAEIDSAVTGAAFGGHSTLVMSLLSRGASKVQAIIFAAKGEHPSLVEQIFETAADLEKRNLIGWAVTNAELKNHFKTEDLSLRRLSSFKNPALRTLWAEKALQTHLLPKAHTLRSLFHEKGLSFDQGLIWLKPEVQGLLIIASSEDYGLPRAIWLLIASYYMPANMPDNVRTDLVQKTKDDVKKLEVELKQREVFELNKTEINTDLQKHYLSSSRFCCFRDRRIFRLQQVCEEATSKEILGQSLKDEIRGLGKKDNLSELLERHCRQLGCG